MLWTRRDEFLKQVLQRLVCAQDWMKRLYHQGRREGEFEVGDWVYLKLQAYRQSSIHYQKHPKLSPKFYRPYQIIHKVSQVAYKLAMPENSRIHPVFHTSLLKRRLGLGLHATSSLPEEMAHPAQHIIPQAILEQNQLRGRSVVLVHWTGFSPAEATWEDKQEFLARYPYFSLVQVGRRCCNPRDSGPNVAVCCKKYGPCVDCRSLI